MGGNKPTRRTAWCGCLWNASRCDAVSEQSRRSHCARIEEFEPEKAWWFNREETESAWRVDVEMIKADSYDLEI